MIVIYTIKTPNPQYNGITEGVAFVNGVAEVKDEIARNILVNNYGYIDATETVSEESEEIPESEKETVEPKAEQSKSEETAKPAPKKAPAKRRSSAK